MLGKLTNAPTILIAISAIRQGRPVTVLVMALDMVDTKPLIPLENGCPVTNAVITELAMIATNKMIISLNKNTISNVLV